MDIFQNGAVVDTRPEESKKKDFKQEEVVASASTANWVEKPESAWRKFPIFNQNGSGSCVAQTEAKEMGIMRWLKDKVYVHFSATDIYQRRFNKPVSGMAAVDARDIIRKGGATLEVLSPSQGMTDSQMDTAIVESYKRAVGEIFKVPNYLELPVKNIDKVASTIEATGKGVMVWFYFKHDEWSTRPTIKYPNLDLYEEGISRHSVTAVDYTLINGVKCLIIEDSWGPGAGIGGQRIIDETFFIARNWYASYLINFCFEIGPVPTKPKYTFNKDLEFGMTDADVKGLQDCLRYEGLFPSNTDSTGLFGAITKKAVQDFQLKHVLTTSSSPGFGRVGPVTRAKLNSIYSV